MFGYYLITVLLLGIGTFLNRKKFVRILLLIAFLLAQTAIAFHAYLHLNSSELGGNIHFDSLGVLFLYVLTLISYTTVFHSYLYLNRRNDDSRIQSVYFTAMIILVGAMTCAYLAATIGVMWVVIEITTLSVAVLIYHERTHLSLEATWKYVFICSIGITFAFVGIVFLSKALQEANSVNLSFSDIPNHLQNVNTFWLKLAFIFMLVGFSTKMGLFPMHTIEVDANTVAPPPISAFISTALLNVGFMAIFRTYSIMSHTSILPWMNHILLWCGFLSIFVSTVYIISVNHLKRMFAYSSLEHMGLVAIGLASGGIGYFAAILHMVLHSLVKASVFYQIDQVYRVFKTFVINKTGDYFNKNLTGALVMLLIFVSITAMPPSGMFVSEFLIFRSLFESHNIGLFIFILLFLTMIMWALGRNIFSMVFLPQHEPSTEVVKINPWESGTQFFLLFTAIYLGLNPPALLLDLIHDAIHVLP